MGLFFNGYSGIELARFGTDELGVVGIGAAYEPRTPTSVRLLLAGLGASSLANPAAGWTDEGDRVFLNALRWAAAPGLASLSGRVAAANGDPIAAATVRIAETGRKTETGADGSYELPHPAGSYTVEVSAFGYVTQSHSVTLTGNDETQLDVALGLTAVGSVTGVVTSRPDISPNAGEGEPLCGRRRRARRPAAQRRDRGGRVVRPDERRAGHVLDRSPRRGPCAPAHRRCRRGCRSGDDEGREPASLPRRSA